MIIFIGSVFFFIFVIFILAAISASKYKYDWHSFCIECDRSVSNNASYCPHCGLNIENWKEVRRLIKNKNGSTHYEYKL